MRNIKNQNRGRAPANEPPHNRRDWLFIGLVCGFWMLFGALSYDQPNAVLGAEFWLVDGRQFARIHSAGFAYLLGDHRCGSGLAFLQPLSRARKPRGAVGGPVSPGAIGGVADATQPAFPLQHIALDCGARTQPEKPDGGQDDRRAERVVAPLTGERRPTGSFAPRGTGFHRRLSGNSAAAFFRPLADRIEDRAGNAQRKCAEYDFAAAGRECDPAWSRAATGRSGRDQRRSYGRAVADRGLQQRRSASR